VAEGELILNICADEHMPAWSTLCGWKRRNPEFAAAYARARETSAEMLEEQALARAMNATAEDAHAARLEVDALKWAAAKRAPRQYGDKVNLDHGGKIDVTSLTDEQLNAKLAELLERAGIGAAGAAILSGSAIEARDDKAMAGRSDQLANTSPSRQQPL
jgi:hypothetical protein